MLKLELTRVTARYVTFLLEADEFLETFASNVPIDISPLDGFGRFIGKFTRISSL